VCYFEEKEGGFEPGGVLAPEVGFLLARFKKPVSGTAGWCRNRLLDTSYRGIEDSAKS